MYTRLIYNNKAFKIIDNYTINFSNSEVTFNDIKIDFTGFSIADIPYKYQEVQIKKAETEQDVFEGDIIFTGYVDSFDISEIKLTNNFRELTLTLLSPLEMATRRSVTLVGTYELEEAVERILQPLVDDGFTIKEMNIPESQITTNYVLQTVEHCMNDIGYKRSIFWYINELKEIYVNSIDFLFRKRYKENYLTK